MKKHQEDDLIFFGEYVLYKNDDESSKEEARQYLKSWKKYLLIKLRFELYDYEPYDGQMVDGDKMKRDPDGWYEHWFELPSYAKGCLAMDYGHIGLKFCMKKKLPYQL